VSDVPDWTTSVTSNVNVDLTVLTVASASPTTGQVAIGTVATEIAPARANRTACTIHCPSSAAIPVYVGFAGVTTATGFMLEPGHSIAIAGSPAIYGIATATGVTVSYEDE
jgi:hypothetical protein